MGADDKLYSRLQRVSLPFPCSIQYADVAMPSSAAASQDCTCGSHRPGAMKAALCSLTLGSSAGVWGTHLSHATCCTMVAIPRNSVLKSRFCRERFWGKLNSDAVSFSTMAFAAAEKQSCGLQLDGFRPLDWRQSCVSAGPCSQSAPLQSPFLASK